MRDLLPFIIVGLTRGSVYGLAGMGLVLTFKTSGIFNFAHGGVAAATAYVFYDLHFDHRLPWPLAAAICVLVLGPVLGLVLERLAGALADARPVMTIVATVGLFVFIEGFLSWKYSPLTLQFPRFLPTGFVELSSVNVQYDQIITMVIGLLSAAGLYVFFRTSRLGMAMRGVVDDPALLSLTGEKPRRVRSASWMLGCAFAALSGLLIGPTFGRDPILLTLLVVQAFGAAAIGAFSSLPLTYLGGLVVGLLASLATKAVSNHQAFAGIPIAMPFLVLFVALLVTPARRLGVRVDRQPRRTTPRAFSRPVLALTGVAGGGFLLIVPAVVGAKLPVYISGLTYVIVFLSLALLLWTSGQISLSHAVFVALGATTFSHLTQGAGLPWPVALVLAGLATVPAGAVIAIPAIRLHGVYLALATFGFALLMERVVYGTGLMFGRAGYRAAPRPQLAFLHGHADKDFYYVVLFVAVLCCAGVVAITRSRMGRFLRALGDAPEALTVHGLSVNLTRLLVFCTSAFLAGVAGALFISASGQVSGDGFSAFNSLLYPTVLAIFGTSLLRSSILGAFALAVLPAYMPSGFSAYQSMIFGLSAVAAAVLVDRRVGTVGERTADRVRFSPVLDRLAARRAADERRRLASVRTALTIAGGAR